MNNNDPEGEMRKMTGRKSTYETPFNARYASEEMQFLFSPDKKFRTWRKLWIALAESEKELGFLFHRNRSMSYVRTQTISTMKWRKNGNVS